MYTDLRFEYSDLLTKVINENNWEENKDTRIVSIKLMMEPVQSTIILLHLINEHFGDIGIWKLQKFSDQKHKDEFLNNRLSFIVNELRENLFINIFLRFENFIKLLSNSVGLHGDKINKLCKDLIEHLNLKSDYKDFIDILTYTRNTMHTEGFHTRDTKTINYNGIDYNFVQNEPLLFYNEDSLKLILIEIRKLMEDIIMNSQIKAITQIGHTYKNILHYYEE